LIEDTQKKRTSIPHYESKHSPIESRKLRDESYALLRVVYAAVTVVIKFYRDQWLGQVPIWQKRRLIRQWTQSIWDSELAPYPLLKESCGQVRLLKI